MLRKERPPESGLEIAAQYGGPKYLRYQMVVRYA